MFLENYDSYSLLTPSREERRLMSLHNSKFSSVEPNAEETVIAEKMFQAFKLKYQYELKEFNGQYGVKFITLLLENFEKIFDSVYEEKGIRYKVNLTEGVYKHFYNLCLLYLQKSGINICNSMAMMPIDTIQKEVNKEPSMFNKNFD